MEKPAKTPNVQVRKGGFGEVLGVLVDVVVVDDEGVGTGRKRGRVRDDENKLG
jgi:hypothetical protein